MKLLGRYVKDNTGTSCATAQGCNPPSNYEKSVCQVGASSYCCIDLTLICMYDDGDGEISETLAFTPPLTRLIAGIGFITLI
jgi:hypothetical protein